MKKIAVVFCLCTFCSPLLSQILFTYGKNAVSKQEFLKAYYKNNSAKSSNDATEYLTLYINYKLKLQEAKDEQLDTLNTQKADLQNFANQIAPNYLLDSAELIRLAKEAIIRSETELHLTYVFIPKNDLAQNHLLKFSSAPLSKQIQEIKLVYSDAVYEDVNFITVFSLPYEMENIVYALPLNQISKPYQKEDGTYYFEVTEKRSAVIDKVQTAQILISVEPFNQNENIAKQRADSLYRLLRSGADFASLATQFSEDKSTASNGGMMDQYGISKYSKEFNDVVLGLQHADEISQPFKTKYGYHIVKLISKTLINTSFEETNLANWKQRVMDDERVKLAKEKLIAKLTKMIKPKSTKDLSTIMDYYRKNLIAYNPRFKQAVKEYEEGNLVFELMNENVWQKAITDTVGVFNFYTKNKSHYNQKKFDEIKGQVINDYQVYLESNLIDRIKLKYPVTINKQVLRSI